MKPPHRFRTHQEDPLARCYNKLDPNVLVFASNSVEVHRFLSQRHTHVLSRTTACIYNPCDIVDIDSWCKTALFAFRSMPAAPDRSFNENRTPGSAPSYRWYTKIQVACQNVRSALVAWQSCDEELDLEFRNKFQEDDLPNQIRRLNCMHRELYGIDNMLHVAEGIDLFFKYRRFWTVGKMRQPAASAILILGLIRDLTKVCRADDWIFQDGAPFLANKIDLLLRRHQLQGPRGTIRLRYKRYQCAPVRIQDLMVQLQEYHRLEQSTAPYPYNVVASGAPINLVQLSTTYQISTG